MRDSLPNRKALCPCSSGRSARTPRQQPKSSTGTCRRARHHLGRRGKIVFTAAALTMSVQVGSRLRKARRLRATASTPPQCSPTSTASTTSQIGSAPTLALAQAEQPEPSKRHCPWQDHRARVHQPTASTSGSENQARSAPDPPNPTLFSVCPTSISAAPPPQALAAHASTVGAVFDAGRRLA